MLLLGVRCGVSAPLHLFLTFGTVEEVFSLDASGLRAARAWLGERIPGSFADGRGLAESGGVGKLLNLLEDPELMAQFERISGLGGATERTLMVELGPKFAQGHIFASRPEKGAAILVAAEGYLNRTSRVELAQTLLHEAGHMGDASSCGEQDEKYGPDASHYYNEILTPALAFKEGWGNYQEFQAKAKELPRFTVYLFEPIYIEGVLEAFRDQDGVHEQRILPEDLFFNDLLSNEAWVAFLLDVLSDLSPGRKGVEAAFLDTQGISCRNFQDLFQAYLKRFPKQEKQARGALENVLLTRLKGTETEKLLQPGALPWKQVSFDLPRSRIYFPSSLQIVRTDLLPPETSWKQDVGDFFRGLVSSDPEEKPVSQEGLDLPPGWVELQKLLKEKSEFRKYLKDYPWDRWLQGKAQTE
jgi:hypothetical protein